MLRSSIRRLLRNVTTKVALFRLDYSSGASALKR
jgi:hypothetical protein